MWQIMMFNSLKELNDWLKDNNVEEVKEYNHYHYVDYYVYNGQICNQWDEYTVLVKARRELL
jgi:hypothetical protein